MPLLPSRGRRRLLGDTEGEATPRVARPGRATTMTQTFQTQAASKMPGLQRKKREVSVISDVSAASSVPAASTRSHDTAKKKRLKATPVVPAVSDDDTATPVTRSGRSGATSTLEGDYLSSATRSTQAAPSGRRRLLPADDDGDMVSGRSVCREVHVTEII